jgi:hypothetical protein
MTWLFDGRQIGIVRGRHFHQLATESQGIVFEQLTWPELTLVARLPLPDLQGEPCDLIASPQGTRLSLEMQHYPNYLYRISLAEAQPEYHIIAKVPFFSRGDVVDQTADDMRLIVLITEGIGWPTHAPMFEHPRRFVAGSLLIYDEPQQTIRQIPLLADFPGHWVPDLTERRPLELPWFYQTSIMLVEAAQLVDDATVRVRFATGEEQLIDITPPAPPPADQ